MRTRYTIDSFQKTYFVINSFQQLYEMTEPDFTPIYQQLQGMTELAADEKLLEDVDWSNRGCLN